MIFVTVGTQLPFDRLINAMSRYQQESGESVIAQTLSNKEWPGLVSHRVLPKDQFDRTIAEARIIVSHAGIGSLLAARTAKKPIVILPRRREFREHRNDHQLDTAVYVDGRPGIAVAWHESEIPILLDEDFSFDDLALETNESQPLEETVRQIIIGQI